MKLVQFIHPMFLAALGLHVSLMLVPIGGDAEPDLIEEDVPLAELTENPSRATPQRLPVPDPNVDGSGTTPQAATANAAAARATNAAPPRRAAPRKVTPAVGTPAQVTPSGSVRPAGSATTPAAASGPTASAGNSNAGTVLNQNAATQNTAEVTTPAVSTPPDQAVAGSNSDVDAGLIGAASGAANSERTSGTASEGNTNSPTLASPTLAALIESVQAKLPSALESSVLTLAEALVYRAEGTDDDSANELREAWVNTVSPLASRAGAISRVAPTVVSDVELNYPIASAVIREGRSLDVCLDENPSSAEIGLLFNSQGELAIEPEVLRSTGYEALNLELIEMLKDEENFPSNRQSKAYVYEIAVDYDAENCVNLNELKS